VFERGVLVLAKCGRRTTTHLPPSHLRALGFFFSLFFPCRPLALDLRRLSDGKARALPKQKQKIPNCSLDLVGLRRMRKRVLCSGLCPEIEDARLDSGIIYIDRHMMRCGDVANEE
jgi:hypothetical protein